MRRGPAPKPTRWRIIAGNPSKRPLPANEPKPKLARNLKSPVELDEFGEKFWRYHARILKRIRVLSEADLYALAAASQWWSIYQRAMDGLKKELTQVSEANGEVAKPSVAIARQAFSQCWAIMSAFGLNPGDRSKLQAIAPDPQNDPFAKYSVRRFLT